ncbi:MAG: porin [Planctomycetia bacterium]|nr:porin [Planctomycetia bacterium]
MQGKWCKYVISSVIILCVTYISNMGQDTYAQQSAQQSEVSGGATEDLKWQLKQMEESLAKQQEQMKQIVELATRQQEQIQVLRNRIDTTSPQATTIKTEEIKSTLAKEEDIKQVVDDYLSTDEARKKMGLGLSYVTAEYTPDDEKYALGLKSADGNFSLNTGARMQFRYTFEDNDEDFGEVDTQDVTIRRARVYFGGNIYSKMVHYYVEADFDNFTAGMRDFYVYFTPLEDLNAKIGYFKVPFNRQRMASSAKLLLQDRSIASEEFDQDRDYGADIYGKPFEGYMEYHAALFQGAGEKNIKGNTDNTLMYVLNVRYNPFGKYDYYDETDVKYSDKLKATVGASVVFNAKDGDKKLENTDTIDGVVDLGVKYRGLSWNNEYYVRTEDPEDGGDSIDSDGFFTQAGYFVIPKKLEVAARYSMLDPNTDVSDDLQREYTGGINYYFRAHRSKIQADFGHFVTNTKTHDKQEEKIRIQYQIIF